MLPLYKSSIGKNDNFKTVNDKMNIQGLSKRLGKFAFRKKSEVFTSSTGTSDLRAGQG
jgi:hypothetical protein